MQGDLSDFGTSLVKWIFFTLISLVKRKFL